MENSKDLHCLWNRKKYWHKQLSNTRKWFIWCSQINKACWCWSDKYSGYGIGFDRKGFNSIGDKVGRNIIIFEVDMSSSLKVDNKGKEILFLGKDPTQGLGEHSLSAEKLYSINFTKENLSLHYNGANSYLFVNGTEIIKFKVKDSKISAYSLCLGNV